MQAVGSTHIRLFQQLVLAILAAASSAAAQSTAFTYQGRLKDGAAATAGLHDFRFRLFDAASGGTQFGSTQCLDNILISEGLFTATIDFGQQYVSTSARFLDIEVRADSGLNCANTSGFVALAPRQLLTAAPLASHANHANAAFSLDAADGSPASAVHPCGCEPAGTRRAAFPLVGLRSRSTSSPPVRGNSSNEGTSHGPFAHHPRPVPRLLRGRDGPATFHRVHVSG